MPIALIVHGGAKEIAPEKEQANRDGCRRAVEAGWEVLQSGGSALDAVEKAIRVLEDDPTYNAGRGSELNADGDIQMDAALMDGRELKSGGVGFIQNVRHPITVARRVHEMESVLLVGDGAYRFAAEHGLELCPQNDLMSQEKIDSWLESRNKGPEGANNTVGCVALDASGIIAAGASTGGTGSNPRGRLGDSPQVGCGIYADDQLGGCSMTGDGEEIARLVLAKFIVDQLDDECPEEAARHAIEKLEKRLDGEGGCIVLDPSGNIGWWHNSSHMAVAYISEAMPNIKAFVSKQEEGK